MSGKSDCCIEAEGAVPEPFAAGCKREEKRAVARGEREAPGMVSACVIRTVPAAMQLHDTVLRMRELLIERGVDLTPARADGRAEYKGPGENATQAWEAFRTVAVEPAFDPIREWGDVQAVRNAGFLFEGLFSPGWPGRHGRPDVPEHYGLGFRRQFGVGEYGDMMGLDLSISFAAADELRELRAELWGDDRGDFELFVPVAHEWIAQVETSPAFTIPMTRHQALGFSFGVDSIG
jgi:hypothetical protein